MCGLLMLTTDVQRLGCYYEEETGVRIVRGHSLVFSGGLAQ